jgi:hypothetical protein
MEDQLCHIRAKLDNAEEELKSAPPATFAYSTISDYCTRTAMGFRSIANAYQSERRMIQSETRIWKRVHKNNDYRSWLLSTKDGPITQQMREGKSHKSHDEARNKQFCESFMRLSGEIRNQIYDALLVRQSKTTDEEDTILFRSLHVTKRSHAAASFSGPMWFPIISHKAILNHVGRDQRIWSELFTRWTAAAVFKLVEAFELQSKPPSIKDKLPFTQSSTQNLPFTRYHDEESSRIFDHSFSWFSLLKTCSLNMHIFNIGSSSFEDSDFLSSRLKACMEEVVSVLSIATKLSELVVNIYLWPDSYQESSSHASWSRRQLPSIFAVWTGLEPLKSAQGIRSVSVRAGAMIHREWTAKDDTIVIHA